MIRNTTILRKINRDTFGFQFENITGFIPRKFSYS